MGWEVRHGGHRYLYRNRRVNGKPVKEYLGADDRFGTGVLLACQLEQLQARAAERRRLLRDAHTAFRDRIDDLLHATASANADLRTLTEGTLYALGYHKHNRGEWRMSRELTHLKNALEKLKHGTEGPKPLIRFEAPENDAQALALFAKARAGDAEAKGKVGTLLRERRWVDSFGNLGRQATRQLIRKAAGGDPIWETAITEHISAMRTELLGTNPTALEELLVRRVLNGWITTHALELELAIRPPTSEKGFEYLDRALGHAQKRFTEAVRELARVRQLRAPAILAQLNVAAAQTVVNNVPNNHPGFDSR
ncbi:hypothetical protein VT84_02980 [Gemmata sp. SH-PL17]|uniref:hypothetical protein n=1 Tax=Gemmata sp. SH-PL17 TaxID=1630693 RepID=UPI00078D4F05|nr:hypothetical protein [Gemmata sp. SH-PL17]AMV23345.1 hypothetical protein VT84_02980 [Gemmata sp. SH-PL17]